MKIMIVEDNALVAEDTSDCLKKYDYIVTSICGTGELAIQNAETDRPDIILMDINLRGSLDGIDAAKQIYERFHIPCIFLSAYSDKKILERAKQIQALGFLIKPFKDRELFATLELAGAKIKFEKKKRKWEQQQRKEEHFEMLGRLAGGLAHDYNNLLYSIMGNISLLEFGAKKDEKNRSYLREAEKGCQKAVELTQKLITFSKGGNPIKKRDSIYSLIEQSVDAVFKDSCIELKYEFPNDRENIDFDRRQMNHVISNICMNAKEAMEKCGTFVVSVEKIQGGADDDLALDQKDYIKMIFRDDGCGILQEHLEKIFDPYFTTKEMGPLKGQGLGLSICKSIVARHNGLMKVRSQPQKGTTVIVCLPV